MNSNFCVIAVVISSILLLFTLYIYYKANHYNKSKYFEYFHKNVSCRKVFVRMMNRKPAKMWPPPKSPPPHLFQEFTQNGEMPLKETYYFAQKYSGSTAYKSEWNVSMINEMIKNHKKNKQIGGYGPYEEVLVDIAVTKYSVTGKDVAVIGSEAPWVEAIVASKNPKSITTIEYGKINCTIPYITTYTPSEFAENSLKKEIEFDFVISHSSMEHSGLGRYGDELEPDGDIHAAEEVWCMLKNGGYFLVGLPFSKKSYLRWNAERNYGPERMKYFAANFEQVEFIGKPWKNQYPLLLRKMM